MERQTSAMAIVLVPDDANGYSVLALENDGEWVFPNGHVEPGETLEQTAVREALEETGVDISGADCLGHITTYQYHSPQEQCTNVIQVYAFLLGKMHPIHVREEEGFTDGQWLTIDEALERLTHDDAREALSATLTRLLT